MGRVLCKDVCESMLLGSRHMSGYEAGCIFLCAYTTQETVIYSGLASREVKQTNREAQ